MSTINCFVCWGKRTKERAGNGNKGKGRRREENCVFRIHLGMDQYIGWSDVTESVVTIQSPFCGYKTTLS